MERIYFTIVGVVLSFVIFGQSPIAEYNFDNCDLLESTGIYEDGIITGSFDCICGFEGMAIALEDGDDFIQLDSNLRTAFDGDFTLSFAFMLDTPEDFVDILSFQKDLCGQDSSLTIKYIKPTNELIINFDKSIGIGVELTTNLDINRCWHHIIYTRKNDQYSLFYNGIKVESKGGNENLMLGDSTGLFIGNGGCIGMPDSRFKGYLDEIKIYNIGLNDMQAVDLYKPIDMLVTNDTTIILGNSVPIIANATCANSFLWTPNTDVSDPAILEPLISNSVSRQYELLYSYDICVALDSIFITIADPNQIDCSLLLLPNVFTPNGDGRNDYFGISNSFIIDELDYFEIFDRWGGKVFTTVDKNDKWDGFFNGSIVNSGLMIYKIKYKCSGEEFTKTGSFSILR